MAAGGIAFHMFKNDLGPEVLFTFSYLVTEEKPRSGTRVYQCTNAGPEYIF